jgi:hypothetical protein
MVRYVPQSLQLFRWDSEELSDYELDDVKIIEIPTSRVRASNQKVNR